MTREQLEAYKSKKAEIKELEYKLAHLGEGDSMIGNSTIMDYRSGYPQPQTVVGVDWKRLDNARARYIHRLEKLKAECAEIEDFVESISDSLTRRIFRMYFIDGISQDKVAKAVHVDKSTVSRKIDKFFKVATNATNATL